MIGVASGSGLVLFRAYRDVGGDEAESRDAGASVGTPAVGADVPPRSADNLFGLPVLASLPAVDGRERLNATGSPRSRFAVEMRKVHDVVRANHTERSGP